MFGITPHIRNRLMRLFVMLILAALFSATAVHAQKTVRTGTIQGMVTDSASKTPLAGVAVTVEGTSIGATSDSTGRYRLENVPLGSHNIRFSLVGYKALVKTGVTVNPGRIIELSVLLDEEAIMMESVTTSARESYFEKNPEAEVSGRTIDAEEIMHSAGGLMDVQRVVQVLPSVTSGSDQMNEIIVRGGNYNENLFVMDGIEIPNPNHFAFQGAGGGPISMLRTEFISDVNFLAGAFPARFGDKASSVMDISLRSGNREKMLTTLDTSMAGAGFMAEGPLGDRGSFLLSGRKSYLDLIIASTGITAIPRYYNLQGKATWSLGKNSTLLLNTLYGSDTIRIRPGEDYESDEYNVSQSTDMVVSGVTLRSFLTNDLYGEGVLSFVRNHWSSDVWDRGATRSDVLYANRSVESETTLRYNLAWTIGKHELSGGFSLKNSRFNHDIFSESDTVYTYDTSFAAAREDTVTGIYRIYPTWKDNTHVSTWKTAAYAQLRLTPLDRLTLRLGARYDHFAYTGRSNLAPRLGLRCRLTDTLWLNGAYGVHYQSPSYLELTVNPGNHRLKSYFTNQAVLGTEWLPRPDTRITVEGYSKRYRDVPVDQSWTTPDPWDSSEGRLVNAARGHSEGIEWYLQKKMSASFMYILSYSYYRAWFVDPRNGSERPWDFDHRNLATLSGARRWSLKDAPWYQSLKKKLWYKATAWLLPFGDEVLVSAKWRFAGGRPYTEPSYLRPYHVWIVPPDTPYNIARFPDYQRFDIRLDRRFFLKRGTLVVYTDVMNVFNRDNIWDYSRDGYGKTDKVSQFSTFPVGGISFEF
jgi:hypothetical protein